MSKPFFAMQQAGRTADVYIFGDIVVYEFFEGDVSANSLVAQIKGLDVDEINVYIDSYGGAVSEGWAIYQALRQHPATVNTFGMGFVASAALFPFLAGTNRCAMSTSAYYLHQVAVDVYGNADDLRAAANEVDMMTDVGIAAFTETTSLDAATVKKMMQEEVWLSPAQVLELGIATAINADQTMRHTQSAKKQLFNRLFALPAQRSAKPPTPPEAPTQTAAANVADAAQSAQAPPPAPQPPAPEHPPDTPPCSIMQMLAGILID